MFSSRMLLWNKTYCVCSEKDRAPRIVDVAQKDSKGNNKNETTSSANVRLKFNILERKKKRKKNYLHCVLYKIYIYDPLSYLIFFICVLDPIWYPLITKSFEWMTSFRKWQEALPYSQASACTNSDVVRVSVSRLVHWHR